MKIMIHSNAPWVPTGYGKQTKLLVPRLRADGHEVVLSAFSGLHAGRIDWEGCRVLPGGQMDFGVDVLPQYIFDEQPDLVLLICDVWPLLPIADQLAKFPVACWLPSDCSPLSAADASVLKLALPKVVAMTQFAHSQIEAAGFASAYIPHGVDVNDFHTLPQPKAEIRKELNLPEDKFIIGMVAANNDMLRKGFSEQFEAFRRFQANHKNAALMVHTIAHTRQGVDLLELATRMGVMENTIFAHPYPQVTGLLGDDYMCKLYNAIDVLSACSYGEGFCVPIAEAQACGTPVISTGFGAMAEVNKGVTVAGEPFFNPVHSAWWTRPNIAEITKAYSYMASIKGKGQYTRLRNAARNHAVESYDADMVYNTYWRPFLERWAER